MGEVEGVPIEAELVGAPSGFSPENDCGEVVKDIAASQLVDTPKISLTTAPRQWKKVTVERVVKPPASGGRVDRAIKAIPPCLRFGGDLWDRFFGDDLAVSQEAEEQGSAEER